MSSSRRQRNNQARLDAAAAVRLASEVGIPGAVWSDIPLYRSHLPGLPYSYYDDEIVMLNARTAILIERQKKELERRQQYAAEDWEQSQNESGWVGVDE
jgi:hypothetical protein